MIAVCVSGARGRMGRMLVDLVQQASDLQLVAALERPGHEDLGLELAPGVLLSDELTPALAKAEVLLDFSLPAAVVDHARLAVKAGKALVTGTTGFSPEQSQFLRDAGASIPLVCAPNMSLGVHLLKRLVAQSRRALIDYDAEIFEIHHRHKADSPSGTALDLAAVLAENQDTSAPVYGRRGARASGEIGLASARGGDVVGEHQVMFLGPGEQVILTHRATTREHFCRGALAAVRFVASAPAGFFGMDEVLAED